MSIPYLSIIIPAYNEEVRLPSTLTNIQSFLIKQSYPAEVLVIENGSNDRTLEVAEEIQKIFPVLTVFHLDERGKGIAVKTGMLAAKGKYRFICDADLSMPIEEVNHFLPPILVDIDIAIASREASGAVRYDEPQYRHFIGRIFNGLVQLLALPGLQDTQCGFKCFRAEAAERIFPLQTIPGWTFDVEVLFIARKIGYHIVEVPIPWYFNPHSKVKFLRDSVRMGLDLFKIRANHIQGRYG
ncbi:MAG TPA: glycosyltransferase family 2 protein [Anaerolineae bacterium]|nr:glycosyltransferase family 2 protein [Anaerolineae bacterium]